MLSIDYKSTGTLLSDLITTQLKIERIGSKEEFKQRKEQLKKAIAKRNKNLDDVEIYYKRLKQVLSDLWWEVDKVVLLREDKSLEQIKQSAFSALKIFELNDKRCRLVQKMDTIFGEEEFTFLEKNY